MATACIPQIAFGFERKGQPIVAAFEQPQASSDGGAVLRKSLDSTMPGLARTCAIDLHDLVAGVTAKRFSRYRVSQASIIGHRHGPPRRPVAAPRDDSLAAGRLGAVR